MMPGISVNDIQSTDEFIKTSKNLKNITIKEESEKSKTINLPDSVKVIKFGKEAEDRTIADYKKEEQKKLEITHLDNQGNAWLKHYGLTSWIIPKEFVQKYNINEKVVPYSLFKDIPHTKTPEAIIFEPKAVEQLKDAIAKHYNIEKNSILTYDEVLDIPEGSTPKWNVLVWKGHGDTAAARKDVLGVYLFFH